MTAFERETLRYLGNAEADERLMALIASVEAELRKDVRQFADDNPEIAAQMIRTLLKGGGNGG